MMRRALHVLFAVGIIVVVSSPAVDGATEPTSPAQEVVDAATLYNAGTTALERGAVGPSVTFLRRRGARRRGRGAAG